MNQRKIIIIATSVTLAAIVATIIAIFSWKHINSSGGKKNNTPSRKEPTPVPETNPKGSKTVPTGTPGKSLISYSVWIPLSGLDAELLEIKKCIRAEHEKDKSKNILPDDLTVDEYESLFKPAQFEVLSLGYRSPEEVAKIKEALRGITFPSSFEIKLTEFGLVCYKSKTKTLFWQADDNSVLVKLCDDIFNALYDAELIERPELIKREMKWKFIDTPRSKKQKDEYLTINGKAILNSQELNFEATATIEAIQLKKLEKNDEDYQVEEVFKF